MKPEHVSAHLYHRYSQQTSPQGTYLELDPEAGTLTADWDTEIGGGVPESVWHARRRRYSLPSSCLAADSINAAMDEITSLAERVIAGYSSEWDGSNYVGRYTEDADQAELEIERALEGYSDDAYCFTVMEADDYFEATHADLVALARSGATDEQIKRAMDVDTEEEVLLENTDRYIEQIREDAKEES